MSHLQVKPTKAKAGMTWPGGPEQRIPVPSAAQKTQQSFSHASNSQAISKKANKRRRQEISSKNQESSSSSLPDAKKSKLSDPSSMTITPQDPALTENPTTTEESALKPTNGVEAGLATEFHLDPSAYEVSDMNIISSSQIQSKVNKILETLTSFSFVASTKPQVVIIHAKAPTSSKCISIVEIAKREIAKAGGKWYQYSRLDHTMAVQNKKSATFNGPGYRLGRKPELNADAMNVEEMDEDQRIEEEESGFETMKTPLERAIEGRPKVRAVPMLFIYLSRVKVESLKQAYGEQTNATT